MYRKHLPFPDYLPISSEHRADYPLAFPGMRQEKGLTGVGKPAPSKPESFPVQFRKTRMCKFHQMGKCTRGKACTHAHSEEELRHAPNLARTCMCRTLLETGVCEDSGCTYAHQLSELKSTDTFFKTRVCFFFKETGQCKLGDKCRYAHAAVEIRENESGAVAESFREQEAHNRMVDSTRRPRLPPGYSSPPARARGHRGRDAYRDTRTYAEYPAAYPGPYPGPPGMHPGPYPGPPGMPYPLSPEHRADYPAFPGPFPGMSPGPYPSPSPRRVPAQPWYPESAPYRSAVGRPEPGTPPGPSQAWMQWDPPTGSDEPMGSQEPELPYRQSSTMSIKNTFLEVDHVIREPLRRVAASMPHDMWKLGMDDLWKLGMDDLWKTGAVEEAQKLMSLVEDPFENHLEDCPLEDCPLEDCPLEDAPERISLARSPVVPKKDKLMTIHNTFVEEPIARKPSSTVLQSHPYAYSVPNSLPHDTDSDSSDSSPARPIPKDRLMAPAISRGYTVHNTFIEQPAAVSPSVSFVHAYSVPNCMNHLAQDTDDSEDSEDSFKNCE